MNNQNTSASNFDFNLATDLDTWGKTMTTEKAAEIMEQGTKLTKEAFLQTLFAWMDFRD